VRQLQDRPLVQIIFPVEYHLVDLLVQYYQIIHGKNKLHFHNTPSCSGCVLTSGGCFCKVDAVCPHSVASLD